MCTEMKSLRTVRTAIPVAHLLLTAAPHAVKYRTMVWWKAAALMLAETVSLGVRTSLSHSPHHRLTDSADLVHPVRVQ